jgi:D-sedoheptulose 7-phosphate isomerase
VIEAWRQHYNEVRPHSSLGYLTPAAFAAKLNQQLPQRAGTLRCRGLRAPARCRAAQHYWAMLSTPGFRHVGVTHMMGEIREEFLSSAKALSDIASSEVICRTIQKIANLTLMAFRANNKLLLCGNGGSAADAQHWAAEFVSRFHFDRPALPAVALTTDTSILTAIGNDYGYERLFARQVEALGQKGDILFAISTSGRSANVLEAVRAARSKEMVTVGFTGANGRELANLVDECISIPSLSTPIIQVGHEVTGHTICKIVEKQIFGR